MSFEWDSDNRSFVTRARCPYPDCGQRTEPVHEDRVLGFCAHCQRTYESALLAPSGGGAPVEWNLRADCAFNTFTGEALTRWSPQDWAEAGGGPRRTASQQDPRGSVFGAPRGQAWFGLNEDWACESIAPEESSDADHVVAVNVARGRVIATTRRGRLGVADLLTGELRTRRPLDWPAWPAPSAIDFPPLLRGTHICLAAPHQALFRDLAPQLFGSGNGRWRLVDPDSGTAFVGPPLSFGQQVVLTQGRVSAGVLEEASLRLFDHTGEELGRHDANGIVRPPVVWKGQVLWLDESGFITVAGQPTLPTEQVLDLRPSLLPTFCVAPGPDGRPELWLAHVKRGRGELVLSRADLEQALERGEVRWRSRNLGNRGEPVGLAVGQGPATPRNASSQLIAVATDTAVLSFPKDLADAVELAAARGHESADRRGSWDSPIVCGAGVLARVPGSVQLLAQGLGWGLRRPEVAPLPVRYAERQGLALAGRRLVLGVGLGLKSFLLKETS